MRKTIMLLSLSFVLNNSYSQVEIIAHRGASYLAPENTVVSSKLVWKLGADVVEIIKAVPKGKELVVEIKCGSEVLPYLKSTIEKNGRNKKFIFISFDLQTITETKKPFPKISATGYAAIANCWKKI